MGCGSPGGRYEKYIEGEWEWGGDGVRIARKARKAEDTSIDLRHTVFLPPAILDLHDKACSALGYAAGRRCMAVKGKYHA